MRIACRFHFEWRSISFTSLANRFTWAVIVAALHITAPLVPSMVKTAVQITQRGTVKPLLPLETMLQGFDGEVAPAFEDTGNEPTVDRSAPARRVPKEPELESGGIEYFANVEACRRNGNGF